MNPPIRIGTATLLKAPIDTVVAWIAYHVNSGIDAMYLFFDDPDDPAYPVVRGLPKVHAQVCDAAFWSRWRKGRRPKELQQRQRAVLTMLLRRPPAGLDWLIHIDTDELLWAPGDLIEALRADLTADRVHVQFLPLEAVPPHPHMSDPFREVTRFKDGTVQRAALARRLHAGRAFRGANDRFLRGHTKGKPAVRLGSGARRMGAHGPFRKYRRRKGIVTVNSRRIRVLHYDAGTMAQWQAKFEARMHQTRGMSPQRRRQVRRFARALQSQEPGRLERRYRREYMLSGWDARVLRALGMVRTIRIPAAMFELPAAAATPEPQNG